ncbi:TPA: DNA-binding G5P domain protein [Escherichia coli]|nr:DNA-binding G5P domain protein [Escherichia coli]
MSNYGLFVKGKMLGARQRNKVNGQGYYNEIGVGLEIPDGMEGREGVTYNISSDGGITEIKG